MGMVSSFIPSLSRRLTICGALGTLLLICGVAPSSIRWETPEGRCESTSAGPGWHQIPNTKLSAVCSNETPVRGNTGCAAIVSAWSGAIADTRRNRLLIWGGGHSDYLGNELYALDLNGMQMHRLNEATLPAASGCQEAIGTPPAPNSRHTYGGLSYVVQRDQMFVFGGALATSGCASHGIWTLDLQSLQWEKRDPAKGGVFQRMSDIPNSDYDPVTKKVYFSNTYSGEFGAYDADTNTVTILRTGHSDGVPNGISSVVDPSRRLFISVGNGFAGGYRLSDGAPFDWSMRTHGCGPVRDALYPGMAYDPDLKRVVLWAGGSTVYLLDPDAKSCVAVTYPGGPGAQQPNGTHGRFRYFSSLGLFVLVNDWQENAWTLCLGGGSAAAIEASANAERERVNKKGEMKSSNGEQKKGSPGGPEAERAALSFLDFRKRCAAAGVLVCEGFDDPGKFLAARSPNSGLYPAGSGNYKGTMDTTTTVSGAGALRFEIDGRTSANSAGFWRQMFGQNFGQNSTFYVQYRFRISPEMLQDFDAGWKFSIFHNGGVTCGSAEITATETSSTVFGMPGMYGDCGAVGFGTWPAPPNQTTVGYNPPYYKQQGDTATTGYNCRYGTDYGTNPGCFVFRPNTWYTLYYKVHIADLTTNGTNGTCIGCYVQSWVGTQGQPLQEWINAPNIGFDDTMPPYNSVDLLNYMTSKDPKRSHLTAYTWYDELIVSSQPIAVPKY